MAEPSRSVDEPSPSKLRRLSAVDPKLVSAAELAFYSEENVRKRYSLMQQPVVIAALDRLWQAANFDDSDDIIDHTEYLEMHRKIALATDATVLPSEWEEAVPDDWERDSEGEVGLNRKTFDWCWFELADLWTESMEAEEYAGFLSQILGMITEYPEHLGGKAVWKSDADVIRAHFAERTDKSHRSRRKDSCGVCLVRWMAWDQKRRKAEEAEEANARRRRTKSSEISVRHAFSLTAANSQVKDNCSMYSLGWEVA